MGLALAIAFIIGMFLGGPGMAILAIVIVLMIAGGLGC